MKGVPIKFRAVDVDSGEYVYGSVLYHGICGVAGHAVMCGEMNSGTWYIKHDTLAQLVGYDINGKEIYESDKLIDSGGIEFTAEMWAMGVNSLDADSLKNGIFKFTLKEGKANERRNT